MGELLVSLFFLAIAGFLFWGFILWLKDLFGYVGRKTTDVVDIVKGSGSVKDFTFIGMPPFQARLVDGHLGDDGSIQAKHIEARGLVPLRANARVGFITSVFDNTSGELEPVFSYVEDLQEPDTLAFQHVIDTGEASPNQGFVKWVKLGVVILDLLQAPYSGQRQLVVMFRMVNLNRMPKIQLGFKVDNNQLVLWQDSFTFTHHFYEKGYEEVVADRDEASALAIKVAMAVAMTDGTLDDAEGETIKKWIIKAIDSYRNERKKNHIKDVFNAAMREAYQEALSGSLNLDSILARLNEIAEKGLRYETFELCHDVMTADGVIDKNETIIIRKIAKALDLDEDQVSKIKDLKILNVDKSNFGHADVEDILGIDTSWDSETIKKHLRIEFQKWNNRLNALEAGEERARAQQMLDWIAEARKKYA